MSIHLKLSNTDELAAFPSAVRQQLVQRALSRLYSGSKLAKWLQIILILGGGVLGAVVMYCVDFPHTRAEAIAKSINSNYLGGGAGCAIGALAWWCLRQRMLRPYLRSMIEEHDREAKPPPLTR